MNNGLCDYVYGSRNFYFHTTLFGICYDSFVFILLYLVYVMVFRSTNMYVHPMLNSGAGEEGSARSYDVGFINVESMMSKY